MFLPGLTGAGQQTPPVDPFVQTKLGGQTVLVLQEETGLEPSGHVVAKKFDNEKA